ncbi:MAG: hypothetical protein IPP67_07665 [Rhodospirillaceae bacterium]|nr:hypothetical protein [Rhodospirillaceae bacterium]
MDMDQFPKEFSDCLTDYGLQLLYQRQPRDKLPISSFLAIAGAIRTDFCERAYQLLNKSLRPHLELLERPIPDFTIWNMVSNYKERLPKVVRMQTAYLDSIQHITYRIAKEIGLLEFLSSSSYQQFVRQITGHRFRKKPGHQVLCYEEGDYIGPHNDHHPEDPEAAAGYLDCHISLVGTGVSHQWLIYEKNGHFSQSQPVHETGLITLYHLPFWHYTTPLVVNVRAKAAEKRRWVLLGTFLFDRRGGKTAKQGQPLQTISS